MSQMMSFLLAVAGLLLGCFASIGAAALGSFSPHALKEICRRRKSPQRLGEILRGHVSARLAAETLAAIGTVAWIAALLFGLSGGEASAAVRSPGAWAAAAAGGVLALLAAVIWIPHAVVRRWSDAFLYYTWPLWRAVGFPLHPLVLAARFFDALFGRLAGQPAEKPDEESFEEDIRTMVNEGHREGLLEEDAREMIEGVIELGEADVSEIMVPRTDMVCISKSLSWEQMLRFVAEAEHTRIPVYDRNRDDIIGVLHAKDLLPELAKGPDVPVQPWTALLRQPYFVPETKPVDVLLQEFQRTHNHMAIVLDEYGGVSGLVTLEDVLEEIVGEIVDEYDAELVDGIRELSPGSFEALGRVHVDEINERLDLDLPDEDDYDTIGGLVFHQLGHVPRAGEVVQLGAVRITVTEASRRRIERVRIEILDRAQRETA